MLKDQLLTRLLNQPALSRSLSDSDWIVLLGQARATDMLATLGERLLYSDNSPHLPSKVVQHLTSANLLFDKQCRDLNRELGFIHQAIGSAKPLLLKGAAYLSDSRIYIPGRMLGDIDLLVKPEKLIWAERTLITHGWSNSHVNAYDQGYYRKWMHEVPSLIHRDRGTLIDLHHHLLPPTSSWYFDLSKTECCWVDSECGRFRRLNLSAMIAHSALHLVLSGEVRHGLRDMWDIRCLLTRSGNWQNTINEVVFLAQEWGISKIVTPVLSIVEQLFFLESGKPEVIKKHFSSGVLGSLLKWTLTNAMVPGHWSSQTAVSRIATVLFYLQGHFYRMPARLLLPHLATKLSFRAQKRKV